MGKLINLFELYALWLGILLTTVISTSLVVILYIVLNNTIFQFLNLNLVSASYSNNKFFGIPEFFSAMAIIVVLYTIIDKRYKFRISVAPFELQKRIYQILIIVALSTLAVEIWFSGEYPIPKILNKHVLFQGILAGIFIASILLWLYFVSKSSVFGKYNYKQYHALVADIILRGGKEELSMLAMELSSSVEKLVQFATEPPYLKNGNLKIEDYANDILTLIGHRSFCQQVVISSPLMAIKLFNAMSDQNKARIPVGQFISTLSEQAFLQDESIIYHEAGDDRFDSVGYHKPFSRSLYGNSTLIRNISFSYSPLKLSYKIKLNAQQFHAYCNCALLFLEDVVRKHEWYSLKFEVKQVFEYIESHNSKLYELENIDFYFDTEIYSKLQSTVEFMERYIILLEKNYLDVPFKFRKAHYHNRDQDPYDQVALFIFNLLCNASTLKNHCYKTWSIQRNTIWERFFSFHANNSVAQKIIQRKVRRMIYTCIKELEDYAMPNFRAARLLGLCLNILGLEEPKKQVYERKYFPLKKVLLHWVKLHYARIYYNNRDLAEECMTGMVTYDSKKKQIVRTGFTYISNKEPYKEYLSLYRLAPR